MGLLRKIYYYLRNRLRYFITYVKAGNAKREFRYDKNTTYTYEAEIFIDDKDTYKKVTALYPNKTDEMWNDKNEYSLKGAYPKTYKVARKLIFDRFLPLFDEKPYLIDVGCAAGEWTLTVAPYCSHIDGYDYSSSLIEAANKNKNSAANVSFFQANAKTMQLDKRYDGGLILGMLIYFDDYEDILAILRSVYNHMKPGALLCARDTMNCENRDVIYLVNKVTGYSAAYLSKEKYYQLFREAGFVLRDEYRLERVNTRRMKLMHMGSIWQKPTE